MYKKIKNFAHDTLRVTRTLEKCKATCAKLEEYTKNLYGSWSNEYITFQSNVKKTIEEKESEEEMKKEIPQEITEEKDEMSPIVSDPDEIKQNNYNENI